ncbi:hypothetical protein [Runella sp.]|uniref:hypothetical protein n=1 Tax=Runella sp. TaxID=1960881 RepID=UPI003D0C83DE
MKYLFSAVLAFCFSSAWAQKSKLKMPNKAFPMSSYTPPNTYRISQNSDIVYAQTDNMPILPAQSPENMPNANLKMTQDSGSVYRTPNPFRREAKPLPKKP